ncbi:hypothetical protein PHYNN_30 [Pantoea phage Phynn]|nr:hypothetical protein PHYNN_30 [Pantoea phage Phynn]
MSNILWHVIYAGQLNVDIAKLKKENLDRLLNIRKRTDFDPVGVIMVDHPNDMEHLVNTLDDLMIPFATDFDEVACVFTIVSFTVSNAEVIPVLSDTLSQIDSRI